MKNSQYTNINQKFSQRIPRDSINLSTLLSPNKILPHYEQVQNLITTGGGAA